VKLKHKAIIIGVLSAIILVGFTYSIFYSVFYGYVNTDIKNQMIQNFETVELLIENEKNNLNIVLRDWAYWDDTYHFIQNGNDQYIATNLQEETLAFLNSSMMVIVNQNGDILGYKDDHLTPEIAEALLAKLKQNHFYTATLTEKADAQTNLILLNGQAYFVGTALVNNSAHTAASNGAIVFVRPFNDSITDYIETVTGLKVTLEESSPDLIPTELEIRHTEFDGKPYLTSTKLQKNRYGAETISMVISKEETNYSFVKNEFNSFITSFILLIAVMLMVIHFIMRRCFFVRIEKLSHFINEVARKKDTAMAIDLPGKDELNILANATNQMLCEIDSANLHIRTMDERHRLIMAATNDGYLDIWMKKQEAYISPAWKKRVGYQGKDSRALFQECFSKLNDDFKRGLQTCFLGVGKSDYFEGEYQLMSAKHGVIWVSHRGKVVERDENNQVVRFVSTLSDITLKKKNEEEILFLNYSDPLTLLRNRDYMKKEFDVLYEEKNPHYFIIMCDVNGLKITNDTFGHREGDQVLIAISNVLRRMCQPSDIISRWPGDEFVILTKGRNRNEIDHLIKGITDEIAEINEFHLIVSVAMGCAESANDLNSPIEVLKMAENRMYRNKLINKTSAHSATIRSLASTLHEKSCETEEHTRRIKELSKALGKRLGLRKDQLDELELLSLLHDTGKIGIPEYILDKPSALTDDEWRVIKTHPKIGYRIAKSTPVLEHIADEILAHHEKYDGTGYPNGLKGKEIPYLGRIINVVDSFDVMTHNRSYKKAHTLYYAVTELKQCAGSQFDPEIVKVFLEMIEEEGFLITLEIDQF
jgi:diguanylate cyclase (GGDEF)-like protein